jgi:hypothetical protein
LRFYNKITIFPCYKKTTFLSEYFDNDIWEYMQQRKYNTDVARVMLENGMNDLTMVTEKSNESRARSFLGSYFVIPDLTFNPSTALRTEKTYYLGYWVNSG